MRLPTTSAAEDEGHQSEDGEWEQAHDHVTAKDNETRPDVPPNDDFHAGLDVGVKPF
jgi:hypothetical protein